MAVKKAGSLNKNREIVGEWYSVTTNVVIRIDGESQIEIYERESINFKAIDQGDDGGGGG